MPSPPAIRLSCGVVIVDAAGRLLLCHVTGQRHWDLPKGGCHAGETPRQAAVRETCEETGLRLDTAPLLDLGAVPYGPGKRLHLFGWLPDVPPDARTLHCDSCFTCARTGRRRPEMDGFGWFAFDRVASLCAPRMGRVLTETYPLPALLRRLQADAGTARRSTAETPAPAPAPVPAPLRDETATA